MFFVPCLWLVGPQGLISTNQVQLAMTLLKHVDLW